MSTEVNHAREQAIAKVESIKGMMDRLSHIEDCDGKDCDLDIASISDAMDNYMDIDGAELRAQYHDADKAREAIDESPLSVEVRTGWFTPGNIDESPSEYCLLLCTGGPAVRIIGTLGNYSEPETASIEYQDWGTPWEKLLPSEFPNLSWEESDALLLSYARQFWYGE